MQSVTDLHRIRRTTIGLSLLFGVPLVAWMMGKWIVAGDSTTPVYAGLTAVVVIISINILNDWRFGLSLSIVWLLFEDLARKYMGNNMAIYFGKDFLIGLTYVSFLFSARRDGTRLFHPPFLFPLSLFFWLGVAQIFNPNSPSIFYGLMGAKLYFYYIPLMFVGYALLRSEEDLRRLLVWNLVLAGVISLLGIIQAIIGPGFLNPTSLAPEIALLSRLYRDTPLTHTLLLRPCSVFVSDGRFGWYLTLMWIIGLGSIAYLGSRLQRGRRYAFLGAALVAAAILLSGSRYAFAYGIISALVLGFAFARGGAAGQRAVVRKVITALRPMAVLVAIALFVLIFVFPSEIGSRWDFYSETLSPTSPTFELGDRIWSYPVTELVKSFEQGNWLIGHGTGTASLGVKYVALLLHKPLPGLGAESGFGALVLELGVVGFLLWIIWSVALLYSSWKRVRCLRGTHLYPVGYSIFWFAALLLLPITYASFTPYQNFILNAYFWLSIGILFRLPELMALPASIMSPTPSVPGQ